MVYSLDLDGAMCSVDGAVYSADESEFTYLFTRAEMQSGRCLLYIYLYYPVIYLLYSKQIPKVSKL